jgi:hypothetical protein
MARKLRVEYADAEERADVGGGAGLINHRRGVEAGAVAGS